MSYPGLPASKGEAQRLASWVAVVDAKQIPGLDFIRAIAILLVLVGHGVDGWTGGGVASHIESASGLGVQLFFVLSGFLITLLLLREQREFGRLDFGRFYWRRASRLLPAFYLYLLVMLAILLARDKPVPWPAVWSSIGYVINYYQAFTGAPTHFLSHCWSLAVEEQFYLIWPVVLAWVLGHQRNLKRVLATIILVVWGYRWLLLLAGYDNADYLYRALETRADHLAIGCLAAVLVRSPQFQSLVLQPIGPWRALLMLIGVVLCCDLESMSVQFKYAIGFVVEPVLLALLMLTTIRAATRADWLSRLINHPALAHIGRVSYGMYLYHGMVMYTTQQMVQAWSGSRWLALLAASAATIGVASLSFRYFEAPLRARLNAGRDRVPTESLVPVRGGGS